MSASLKSKKIDARSWWYEDKRGIEVIVERHASTTGKRIPWSSILKAAKRCGVLAARQTDGAREESK